MTIAMLGRTGAGKTTVAVEMADAFGCVLLESVKMKADFGRADCLDERVRDVRYQVMLDRARGLDRVVLDASFHIRRRRELLYAQADSVVWVYCRCDDRFEVKRRIEGRKGRAGLRHVADSMDVFYQIDREFEELSEDEFEVPTMVVRVDTFGGGVEVEEYGWVPWWEDVKDVLVGVGV